MTYASLMVQLELGQTNAGVLRVAVDLARMFDAHVTGLAVRRPIEVGYGDGFIYGDAIVAAGFVDQGKAELDAEAKAAEAAFQTAFADRPTRIDWRSITTFANLADLVAAESCAADIVITHMAAGELLDATRRVDTGDLVMQSGRPVLIVPPEAAGLTLDHVMLAWKDSRETRKAAAAALPMLKKATQVTLVGLAAADAMPATVARLKQVIAWLGHHGIAAKKLAVEATGDDAAQLAALAHDHAADLIVAGAYGHSRLREWALGGVTRDLLMRNTRCALVTH